MASFSPLDVAAAHASGRTFEPVNDLLVRSLRTYHDRILLHAADGAKFTGAAIEGEIARYAKALEKLGVGLGIPVALLAGNSVEVLFVQHAVSILGGIFTPLHPLGSAGDFAYMLGDAEVDIVVVAQSREPEVVKAVELSGRATRILRLGGGGASDLIQLAAKEDARHIEPRQIDPEAIHRYVYTGGTTGVSKACQASFRAMATMYGIQLNEWEWPDDVRMLLVAPLSHVGAVSFVPAIAQGGTLFIERGFDAAQTLASIQRNRITCVVLVPTMICALLDHPELAAFETSSLETIFYGASPISPARLRAAIAHFGPIFFQFYGQAEAMTTVTTMRRAEHDLSSDRRLSSCGRPVPDVTVRLVDPNEDEVADGEAGELCVRGPLLMSGYLNKPDATEEALRGGWLHTGDIAVRDPDGFLRLVDRAKDLVITGGFNVYPRVVEDVLEEHSAVATACVFGVPDEYWGEALVAAVVLRRSDVDLAELINYVRNRKGAVQTPKRIEVVDSIPLTSVGKPDKKALRQKFTDSSAAPSRGKRSSKPGQ